MPVIIPVTSVTATSITGMRITAGNFRIMLLEPLTGIWKKVSLITEKLTIVFVRGQLQKRVCCKGLVY
jgi:hypothetical protein